MSNQSRQPKGIPVGGQFATRGRSETTVALATPTKRPNLIGYEEVADLEKRWQGLAGGRNRATNVDVLAYGERVEEATPEGYSRSRVSEAVNDLRATMTAWGTGSVEADDRAREAISVVYDEVDRRIRADVYEYGANSGVFREWSQIHADYRGTDPDGQRTVLAASSKHGTVLTAWRGPKALMEYRDRHVEETEEVGRVVREALDLTSPARPRARAAKMAWLRSNEWSSDEIDQIYDRPEDRIDPNLDHAVLTTARKSVENALHIGLPVQDWAADLNRR